MFYVFHDKQLFFQGEKPPSILPDCIYIFTSDMDGTSWAFKHKRKECRPVEPKHIPKEIRLLCLLLNIPLQG